MTDWNVSPTGILEVKYVNSTFLLKINFKIESFGFFSISLTK